MDDHDIILAMAICDLLEKPVTPEAVEKAFEKAKKRLERLRNPGPPKPAKLTHAIRRYETE